MNQAYMSIAEGKAAVLGATCLTCVRELQENGTPQLSICWEVVLQTN